MFFGDYVRVLKRHFMRSISNEELCHILFDSIIVPADLKNRNGEVVTIEKGIISRCLNQKCEVPTLLKDHICDKVVFDGLNGYFKENVIAELVPNKSDLCHQLMMLIDEDQDISPEHKESLRLIAKSDSATAFLVDVFVYVTKRSNKKTPEKKAETDATASAPILKSRIRRLFDEISRLKITRDDLFKSISLPHSTMTPLIRTAELIQINKRVRMKIKAFAEEAGLTLRMHGALSRVNRRH